MADHTSSTNSCECCISGTFWLSRSAIPGATGTTAFRKMLLALVYPIVLGLDRIETASLLRSDGTFQYLTGLQSFPDPQTLRRFLLNAPLISGSSYTMRMIDCCKDSFPCRSIARACSSIWTARWSHPLAIRRALRLATIQASAASGPMIPGSV